MIHYNVCGLRIVQGEIILAPTGLFADQSDLEDPTAIQRAVLPLRNGDSNGITVAIQRTGESAIAFRSWYLPALVVSDDCVIEKAATILLAPIFPLTHAQESHHAPLRSGKLRAAFYLPGDSVLLPGEAAENEWPEAFADFNRIATVTKQLAGAHRLLTLNDDQRDRLHAALVRFLITKELSTRGSLEVAIGKCVAKVEVIASSAKRHT